MIFNESLKRRPVIKTYVDNNDNNTGEFVTVSGIAYATGSGATTMTVTITFGYTFAYPPADIQVVQLGRINNTGGTYQVEDFSVSANISSSINITNVSTTTADAELRSSALGTFSNSYTYGVSYRITGKKP